MVAQWQGEYHEQLEEMGRIESGLPKQEAFPKRLRGYAASISDLSIIYPEFEPGLIPKVQLIYWRIWRAPWGVLCALRDSSTLLAIMVETAALQTYVLPGAPLLPLCYEWVEGEFVWTGIAAVAFSVSTVLIHVRICLDCAHDNSDRLVGNSSPPLPFPNRTLDEEHMLGTTQSDKKSTLGNDPAWQARLMSKKTGCIEKEEGTALTLPSLSVALEMGDEDYTHRK
ncbi:hypothetical protein K438DRAFT_1975389 [Mycena galopus ATCC 62051]|nr:hypothetical protein K438DRAFT_1975389 [Mycena galopus ATCC 62051]